MSATGLAALALTNAQVALICATDADPGTYRVPDGQERTDRITQRAAHFLAFLESADADTATLKGTTA